MATITSTKTASSTGDSEKVPGKKIKIQWNDGQVYEIDEDEIEQSLTIKTLSECMILLSAGVFVDIVFTAVALDVGDMIIPLPNVRSTILSPVCWKTCLSFLSKTCTPSFKIIEFCNHHKNDPKSEAPGEDEDDDDGPNDQYEPKRYCSASLLAFFWFILNFCSGVDPMTFLSGIKPSSNDLRSKMVPCSTQSWLVIRIYPMSCIGNLSILRQPTIWA